MYPFVGQKPNFAGFMFHTVPPEERIDPSDAEIVDVIHTAGLWVGMDGVVNCNCPYIEGMNEIDKDISSTVFLGQYTGTALICFFHLKVPQSVLFQSSVKSLI